MRRAIFLLPLAAFAVIAFTALNGLSVDPARQPSALAGRPLPALALDPLPNHGLAFDERDLTGRWSLLNVFGSWCTYCEVEHPFLMALKGEGVPIYGIDWREDPALGASFLVRNGNPYTAVGADPDSRAILDLGVAGAPETFLIDAEGVIRHRHQGPLDERVWRRDFLPILDAFGAETAPGPGA